MAFNTDVLHKGVVKDSSFGATLTPIYQVSAFSYEKMEDLEKVFAGKSSGFAYTRIGNPTIAAFENRITALEKGFAAVATSSGMAAITQCFLNFLSSGDEVIASSGLYGGTIQLFTLLKNFGITIKYAQSLSGENLEKLYTEKVKAIFVETISNPSLEISDIQFLSDFAHSKQIPLVIDNTTATPFLCNPIDFGADIVIHSSSKYINGSSNGISGVIVDSGNFKWNSEKYPSLLEYAKFGKLAFLAKLRHDTWASVGGCLSPFNAYLNMIGLETLGLRMEKICNNAFELAKALSEISLISVNYPLLDTERNSKALAQKYLKGFAGGILTLRVGSKEKALEIINSLKLATIASNIGDVRTLVIYPASTLYLHDTKEQMNAAGVFDDTIRVSVGIEDAQDLIADFTSAIKK